MTEIFGSANMAHCVVSFRFLAAILAACMAACCAGVMTRRDDDPPLTLPGALNTY